MHPEYTQSQMIANVCAQCGETYYRRWPSLVGRFCSIKCTNISKLQPVAARFWSKVRKTRTCWWWLAGVASGGYGKFWINGRTVHAHRVAWELVNGPMAPELVARHTCDNRLCVRPDHVVPGTNADNSRDMVERGRAATGERHSSRLHPERVPRGDRHRSRTSPETLPRGEKHAAAKLTDAAVLDIRARVAAGEMQTALAREYGVSPVTVGHVVTRKTWTHL